MPKADFWKKYGFIKRSKNRQEILKLMDEPQTPSDICKRTKLSMNLVSRALRELEKEDIVICNNPAAKMGRVYELTKLGKDIIKHLEKCER